MPRIVVLDGFTLNPGDLSWGPLDTLGEVVVHDRTPAEQVLSRAASAEIVLTNKVPINRELIRQLPQLRYIGVLATGYNIIDVEAARERGITVTNVPAYGTPSVAQMVFALLLELTQHVGHHARTVREGRWSASPDFCYWDRPLIELSGLTMGIVGFGRIGRAVAKLADAFGMKVVVHAHRPPASVPANVRLVDLDTLFRQSDVISLHCPLTPETKEMVNAARLKTMKHNTMLINTGRGQLVHDQDLADALNAGTIAGAGLDVLSAEPPTRGNPLLSAKNCYITPHIAWATRSARERLLVIAAEMSAPSWLVIRSIRSGEGYVEKPYHSGMSVAEWAQVVGWCLLFAPAIAAALAGIFFSIYAFANDIWGGDSNLLTAMLLPAAVLLCIAAAYVFGSEMIHRAHQTLRSSWNRRNVNACNRCGYCLIGNQSGICPECGIHLERKRRRSEA